MRLAKPRLATTGLVLALLLLGVAPPAVSDDAAVRVARASAGGGWHEGAEGFANALDEALAEKKPLAVYFYTDWCGYCRQLERELLYRAEVEDYMGALTRVRINPEKGRQESAIAQRYGVFGFPSFFVHPGPGHEAQKVSGRVKRDGRWQMQTPEEFIATLTGIVARAE